MDKFPITKQGYDDLSQKIKHLKYVVRPKISQDIAEASEHRDLSENGEYLAARDEQSLNEAKIRDLEDKYSRAEIIDITKLTADTIKFGASVVLMDCDTDEQVTYVLIGEYEADINKKRVSISSPIAKALIGKRVGDTVEVFTPHGGVKLYEVLKIEYKDFTI